LAADERIGKPSRLAALALVVAFQKESSGAASRRRMSTRPVRSVRSA